jgi:hypothetical protein
MTFRHNSICNILVEAVLRHHKKPTIKQNSTIKPIGRNSELPDDTKILKPDIWFEKDGVIHVIEVTVPYAMQTKLFERRNVNEDDEEAENDPEEISTLEVRRREKVRKYQKLLEDCKKVFGVECKLHIIVVSSLGAIPKETEITLKKLLGCQPRTLSLWLKRLSVAAIRGSMVLFYGLTPRRSERAVPTALDINEEAEEEEDEDEEVALQNNLHEQVLLEIDDSPEEEDEEGGQEAPVEDEISFQVDEELSDEEAISQQQEEQIDDEEVRAGDEDEDLFDEDAQSDI